MFRQISSNIEIFLTLLTNKYKTKKIPQEIEYYITKLAHDFCVTYNLLIKFIYSKQGINAKNELSLGILLELKKKMRMLSKNNTKLLKYKSNFECILQDIQKYLTKLDKFFVCNIIPFEIQCKLINLTIDIIKSIRSLLKLFS
tara:strand:+ start:313 stop:741 length:429 start_codon:yes stop_codon:yes gene_type:complete